jgi:general secretion pathway protein K
MRRMRQRGVALLVAIIIFAFATMVAAAVTYSKAMTARRAAATFTMEQALQAGMAAEALASIVLEQDGGAAQTTTIQDWNQAQQPMELEETGVWIAAKVEDMGGRFNLNSVVKWDDQTKVFVEDPHQVEVFRTILADRDIDLKYAELLVDWIDTDIAPNSAGGEDTLYLSQVPPYRPPNTFITHPSELLALPGFGRDNYRKIAPFVIALPYDVPVNLCTASGLVLDATRNDPQNQNEFRGMDLELAREKGCFPLKNVFSGVIANPQLKGEVEGHIEEKSSWFRLRTNIRVGTTEFVLYSLLYREPTNRVRTVQRNFGSE